MTLPIATFDVSLLNTSISQALLSVVGVWLLELVSITRPIPVTEMARFNVTVHTAGLRGLLMNAVNDGRFAVEYGNATYIASFSSDYFGVCAPGSVSSTGAFPGCITCPSNTYVCFSSYIDCSNNVSG